MKARIWVKGSVCPEEVYQVDGPESAARNCRAMAMVLEGWLRSAVAAVGRGECRSVVLAVHGDPCDHEVPT